MASVFRESITQLQDLGVLQVILPFLFVFTIVFGILEKTRVLGVENKRPRRNLNAMSAFVIAFIFIAGTSRVESLTLYLQILAMGLVFVTLLLFLIASFQYKLIFEKTTIIYLLAFIFVIVGFFWSVGIFVLEDYGFIFELLLNPVSLGIVVFFLLIAFITGGSSKKIKVRSEEKEVRKASKPESKSKEPFLRKLKPEEVPKQFREA